MEPREPIQKSSIAERIQRLHILMSTVLSSEKIEMASKQEKQKIWSPQAGQKQVKIVSLRDNNGDTFGNYVLHID